MPFAKIISRFQRDPHGNSSPLLWARADIDGMPFRGNIDASEAMMREEEFQRKTHEVGEVFYGSFNTGEPTQKIYELTLKDVLDNVNAGWFDLLDYDHTWHDMGSGPQKFVYVVWRENYRERSPYA